MSQALTLARPYARAAFGLARDAGAANGGYAPWSNALAFAARVAADPQVAAVLGSPKLTNADAVSLLAIDGAGDNVRNFLALLADNRRLALLPEIAGLFEELRAEAERVVKARITSASALGGAELDNIKVALKKRFGRDVELETAIDESLIGGAVIDTGDVVIDGSLKGKLGRLQAALAN
ncbi:F0F1 ATP synthase subunit delta [Lysobacter fragariae]